MVRQVYYYAKFLKELPNLPEEVSISERNALEIIGPRIPIRLIHPEDDTKTADGWGLIDTGAALSLISQKVISSFGISSYDRQSITTASGDTETEIFKVSIALLDMNKTNIGMDVGDFEPKEEFKVIAIIGRDILKDFCIYYEGDTGLFYMEYRA